MIIFNEGLTAVHIGKSSMAKSSLRITALACSYLERGIEYPVVFIALCALRDNSDMRVTKI